MKVKARALDTFFDGRLHAVKDGVYTMNKGSADELVAVGLVEIVGDADDDAIDDLVDTKMEPISHNKMEPAPRNKAGGKK